MELSIKGEAKEIAALVLELQKPQHLGFDEIDFDEAIKTRPLTEEFKNPFEVIFPQETIYSTRR